MEMGRRNFLAGGALLAAGAVAKNASAMLPGEQKAWDAYKASPDVKREGIIDSEPLLQSPAPDSMGVGFAVNGMSAGFVEVADNPELKGAKRFYAEGMPVARLDDRVSLVRMTGLKPATRYYYRIGAAQLTHPIG
jgi:phosphodiesterase/alkaline phosphatase D-like protein